MNWKPGSPTASKDWWSVPPVLRMVTAVAPRSYIHVGMMRARGVIHGVLNELETGQPDRVEGLVVRSARVANGHRSRAQIFERLQPRFENRPRHIVALQIN